MVRSEPARVAGLKLPRETFDKGGYLRNIVWHCEARQ
jgi:hypothetical protein